MVVFKNKLTNSSTISAWPRLLESSLPSLLEASQGGVQCPRGRQQVRSGGREERQGHGRRKGRRKRSEVAREIKIQRKVTEKDKFHLKK